MATSFFEWARSKGACRDGLEYLAGKRLTWATWIQSCGEWRTWVCMRLAVDRSSADLQTSRCPCNICRQGVARKRKMLNRLRRYVALRQHFDRVVLPALRAQGVR